VVVFVVWSLCVSVGVCGTSSSQQERTIMDVYGYLLLPRRGHRHRVCVAVWLCFPPVRTVLTIYNYSHAGHFEALSANGLDESDE
jgi:hypothetical protein